MFDPPEIVKYSQTPASVLESPSHKEHALKMARQSIVLLKNTSNTLPLSKSIKKIVILGPNADNPISILGNYNGTPSTATTVYQGIRSKLPYTNVVYEKAVNFTNDTMLVYADVAQRYHIDGHDGFRAEYFGNRNLKGEPEVRYETTITHAWQEGEGVIGNIKATDFSARYTTTYSAGTERTITFEVEGDDGYRLMINGKEVLDAWTRNRWGAKQYKLTTEPGQSYQISLEFWQGDGKANIRLSAGNYQKTDTEALISRIKDADAIIFVGGISPPT